VVCAGARPAAITNCLNFGNPEKPEIMWQFSQAVDGIAAACNAFGTPVTGGNVSFYNETEGQSIYPTPVIGMVGILRGRVPLTPHFKREGDLIMLVGNPGAELGGSRYATLNGPLCGPCPSIDLDLEKRLQEGLLQAAEEGLLESLHDCSDGGLVAAIAESCFGAYPRMYGCDVSREGSGRPDAYLFGETQGRYLLSCDPGLASRLKSIFDHYRLPYSELGRTAGEQLVFHWNGKTLLHLEVEELYRIWYNALANRL
jgi:phosphoribosylformylglycinamidine synthase